MREKLAEYIYNQWCKWAKTIISTESISKERVDRREKECFMPYMNLSKEMKDLDRMFADEILELMENKQNVEYKNSRRFKTLNFANRIKLIK